MKIKQQKQIKAFLIQAFGPDRGGALFARQEEILTALVEQVNDPSERRRETLIQTILPRIALYKALLDGCSEEETCRHMRTYMMEVVAAQKHAATARMELVPGFYALYSRAFLRIMATSDLWESESFRGKILSARTSAVPLAHRLRGKRLRGTVPPVLRRGRRDLWRPEKMGFSRTKTLGYGGDCCDFRFFKK